MTPLVMAMGIDGGITTGWSAIGVPANSIYGNAPGKIKFKQQGELNGPRTGQVMSICHIAKRLMAEQSSRLVIVGEGFTVKQVNHLQEYLESPRLIAALKFAIETNFANGATFIEQQPKMAFDTAPDDRLESWGLYVPGYEHARDATRHAITIIRRAKTDVHLRNRIWGLM